MKLILTNQYSELILLVNGLAVLLFYSAKKKKTQRAMKFGNYETLQKVAGDSFLSSSRAMLILKMVALTSLLVGLSNPVLEHEVPSTGSSYVIALDTSSSMLTSDLEPSRLQSAKTVSREFVGDVGNSTEIGLVTFSGRISNETGLTSDKSKIRASISNLEVGNYAGTAIGDALYSSTTLLLDSRLNRTVVLITDGVNNRGRSINESIEYAEENDVRINTIGIGGVENRTENNLNESRIEFPNLNQESLERISNRTGGNFTTATSRGELRDAFLNIDRSTVRTDLSREFLLLALLLFLGEWALGTTRYDVLP